MNNNNMARRTFQQVHRESCVVGSFEAQLWAPTNLSEKARALDAARLYDREHKRKGRRNGPLGNIGLEVLNALWSVVDFSTGRLEPSIRWLMENAGPGRCRDAIISALKRLARCGFIKWVRRFSYVGERTPRGRPIGGRNVPQVEQATNAYALLLPSDAAALLPQRGDQRREARGSSPADIALRMSQIAYRRIVAADASTRPYRGDHYRDSSDIRGANRALKLLFLKLADGESVTPDQTRRRLY